MSDQKNTPGADSPLPEKAENAGAFPDLTAHSDAPAWLSADGGHDSGVWERSFDGSTEAESAGTSDAGDVDGEDGAAAVPGPEAAGPQDDIQLPPEPVVVAPDDLKLEEPSLAEPTLGSDAVDAAELEEVTSETAAVEANAAEAGRLSGLEPAPAGAEITVDAKADTAETAGDTGEEAESGTDAADTAGADAAAENDAAGTEPAADAALKPGEPTADATVADAPAEAGEPAPAPAPAPEVEDPTAETEAEDPTAETAADEPTAAAENPASAAETASVPDDESNPEAVAGPVTSESEHEPEPAGHAEDEASGSSAANAPDTAAAAETDTSAVAGEAPGQEDAADEEPATGTVQETTGPEHAGTTAQDVSTAQDAGAAEPDGQLPHPLDGIDAAAPVTGALPGQEPSPEPDAEPEPTTASVPTGETRRSRRLAESQAAAAAGATAARRPAGKDASPSAAAAEGTDAMEGGTPGGSAPAKAGGRNTRLLLVIGGVVLVAVVAILLAVFVFNGKEEGVIAEDVSPVELESGACLKGWEDVNSAADVVGCDTPHDAQLVASERFTGTDTFPGTAALEARVNEVCAAVDYVDNASSYPDLKVAKSIPTEQTWSDGDRRLDCFVFSPEGQEITESLVRE